MSDRYFKFNDKWKYKIFNIMNQFQNVAVEQMMAMLQCKDDKDKKNARFALLQMINAGWICYDKTGTILKLNAQSKVRDSVIECIWVALEYIQENAAEDDEELDLSCMITAHPYSRPLKLIYINHKNNTAYYFASIRSADQTSEVAVLNERLRGEMAKNDSEDAPKAKVIIVTYNARTANNIPEMPDFDVLIVTIHRREEFKYDVSSKPNVEIVDFRKAKGREER